MRDTIDMAREAGVIATKVDGIERFEALVRADEREECAKVCDTVWNGDADTYESAEASNDCAAAIRARGQA